MLIFLENINENIIRIKNYHKLVVQLNVLFVPIINEIHYFNHVHILLRVIHVLVELKNVYYVKKMFKQELK